MKSIRILFLCGSLEPGYDGVGDYTRRLAAELIRQGQECCIVSLNDKCQPKAESGNGENRTQKSDNRHSTSDFRPLLSDFLETQQSEGTAVECLRLPQTMSWSERTEFARQYVAQFNPDWVSLQFVPFGFHPKGLCFGLAQRLKTIAPAARWHFMFHELWLGLAASSSVKHRVWGGLQRFLIQRLVQKLKPTHITTHVHPYQQSLESLGFACDILPLFGNIPPQPGDGWPVVISALQAAGITALERDQYYVAGVFGGVHPEWQLADSVQSLSSRVRQSGKRLLIMFIGRNNLEKSDLARWRNLFGAHAEIITLGAHHDSIISQVLQTLDLGLATTPMALLAKSGSVAAMSDHGLKVLATRDDWKLATPAAPNCNAFNATVLTPAALATMVSLPCRASIQSSETSLAQITRQYVQMLSQNSPARL